MKYKIEEDQKNLTGCGFSLYEWCSSSEDWRYSSSLFVYKGITDEEVIKLAKEKLLMPRVVYFEA